MSVQVFVPSYFVPSVRSVLRRNGYAREGLLSLANISIDDPVVDQEKLETLLHKYGGGAKLTSNALKRLTREKLWIVFYELRKDFAIVFDDDTAESIETIMQCITRQFPHETKENVKLCDIVIPLAAFMRNVLLLYTD